MITNEFLTKNISKKFQILKFGFMSSKAVVCNRPNKRRHMTVFVFLFVIIIITDMPSCMYFVDYITG